ncbi:sugar O-acetyltransferase [Chromatiaceae bacterium AAb-1]|nr:sugar O-acetyltransferase [Chromatiaceae bacterium AAb-1]
MKTEKEKMLSGELYNPLDKILTAERQQARTLFRAFNTVADERERRKLLKQLLPNAAASIWIEPPFFCDYGYNLKLGKKVFFNFNCVVLDVAPVTIGDNTLIGPAVQIYTATHPLNAAERRTLQESALSIEIGKDVWIGGGAVICPGVRIGDGAVIGAGSVVTRDIPPRVIAAGNPCRVIRAVD